ncbi:MAG TPA: formate dehydrogenase accessory sulfurtransferase FdhD, partial [Bacteroidetes bacterium]|nr:formate dehydrogenase accessory sulfurtransferase FdhD [Bacteroidota bacterium]
CRYRKNLLVTMRTPGEDEYLAIGLLKSEGIIENGDDVLYVKHCLNVDVEERGNVIRVALAPHVNVDLQRLGRFGFMNSSCGVCGKQTIEAIKADFKAIRASWKFPKKELFCLQEKLNDQQIIFKHTGGLHAAALFSKEGELVQVFEDIGRHNALDKLVGYIMQTGLKEEDFFLWLSGRAGFEMVQKAANAGLPMLISVGAPSSLAVNLAREAKMTLIGFAMKERFNIYTHKERILD